MRHVRKYSLCFTKGQYLHRTTSLERVRFPTYPSAAIFDRMTANLVQPTSRLSLHSSNSLLSIGSKNSLLSIGSVGSVLSIGSVGSCASILSVGSFASALSLMSGLSAGSVMAWRAYRRVGG